MNKYEFIRIANSWEQVNFLEFIDDMECAYIISNKKCVYHYSLDEYYDLLPYHSFQLGSLYNKIVKRLGMDEIARPSLFLFAGEVGWSEYACACFAPMVGVDKTTQGIVMADRAFRYYSWTSVACFVHEILHYLLFKVGFEYDDDDQVFKDYGRKLGIYLNDEDFLAYSRSFNQMFNYIP